MSNRIFKYNQINIGTPFQINNPAIYQPPVRNTGMLAEIQDESEEEQIDYKQIGEEILNKAKNEADLIIKEALLEAKDIITKASTEVEELREQAFEAARQDGYNEGILQAKTEYENLLQEANEIKKQAGIDYKKVLDSIEEDAVNTILDISKKVISQELKLKENLFLLIREAFDKCSKDRKATLKLSEPDFEIVSENLGELTAVLERSEGIDVKKDLSLKQGGCVIETSFGSIDASAGKKLEMIENDFKNVLNETIESNN